jgi:hypothetical protein
MTLATDISIDTRWKLWTSDHRIVPVADSRDAIRCRHCGIRVHANLRDERFRHDGEEVMDLFTAYVRNAWPR